MMSFEDMLSVIENICGKSSVIRNQFRDFKGLDAHVQQAVYIAMLEVESNRTSKEIERLLDKKDKIEEALR